MSVEFCLDIRTSNFGKHFCLWRVSFPEGLLRAFSVPILLVCLPEKGICFPNMYGYRILFTEELRGPARYGTYLTKYCSVKYCSIKRTDDKPGEEWSRDNGIVQQYQQLLSFPSPFTELGPTTRVCMTKQ